MYDAFKRAELKYDKAESEFQKVLIDHVETLARVVLHSDPRAKSFCMAMGSASFYCEYRHPDCDDDDDMWIVKDHLDPEELKTPEGDELQRILDKYTNFNLTGYPMRIDRDPVTGLLVTVNDW